MSTPSVVRAFGPASLSNLGPGFDTLGLCIQGLGDIVEASWSAGSGIEIDVVGEVDVPVDPARNSAGRAAQRVLEKAQMQRGVHLRLHKKIPLGSGLGGSAASAVAGAWAVNGLLDVPFAKTDLIPAVLAGEAVASGHAHGDNVLPSLLGGTVLVSARNPHHWAPIPVPNALHLAVVLPEETVLTKHARAVLPTDVPLTAAVHQASALAFLMHALHRGDAAALGRAIETDVLIEPVRATLVRSYAAIKAGAHEAGALGCALSGSGPALFAICTDAVHAQTVADAMVAASLTVGISAMGYATGLDLEGARLLASAS